MNTLAGKTAVITGGGRGQGRSHALKLAGAGANIVVTDLATPSMETIEYALSSAEDLAETARQVEALGGRVLALQADVRSTADMERVADATMSEFGRIDIVLANAAVHGVHEASYLIDDASWETMIDVNLTGVFKTARAMIPHMIAGGAGGSLVFTSSVDGLRGAPSWGHYGAAKAGLVNLMKTLAMELSTHRIRVNTVHPTGVNTPMADMVATAAVPALERWASATDRANLFSDVYVVEPSDISNAIAWLVSDEARYVTGVALPVDAGYTTKH
ncbi:mycofactocin-coupled SDR family oxidoreductase [Leucobacter chromiireducens]|uniref:NAD(P)-dependent oxidoreductase n=1 Tax=Leucobacter chromiireducens subsp. solipictus TaxID=398235 RepID=A0ABS1SG27_9MICO|nr:NAD(P)-dependent oxidoreductase [Leucobacter chromiireducens subsp. solipictus]